jgi:chorismate dehydratase
MSIKISAVNYLNTLPYVYGLENGPLQSQLEISKDSPVTCSDKLIRGEVDVGLVPVVVIPSLSFPHIVLDYGIASNGPVESVCLVGHDNINHFTRVYLDYQSKTSNQLLRVLLSRFWKLNPELIHSFPGYEKLISGGTGGLLIGDRALKWKEIFPHVYDLGMAWKQYSGLPFVFAAWVGRREIIEIYKNEFIESFELGIKNIPCNLKAIKEMYPGVDIETYLNKNIIFRLTNKGMEGLSYFLQQMENIPLNPVSLNL